MAAGAEDGLRLGRGRRRRAIVAGAVVVVLLAVAVVLVVRVRGDEPRIDIKRSGVNRFPARGPRSGDAELIQRAAVAWRQRTAVLGPSEHPELYLLWAGPRGDRTLVLLAREMIVSSPGRSRLLLGYYVENAAGTGMIDHESLVPLSPGGIVIDATGLLVPAWPEAIVFRMISRAPNEPGERQNPVQRSQPDLTGGVVETGGTALLVPESDYAYAVLMYRGLAVELLVQERYRDQLVEWAKDQEGAKRLLAATLSNYPYDRDDVLQGYLEPTWRGPVKGLGDVLVVRQSYRAQPWYALSAGSTGTAFVNNVGAQPMLLVGWTGGLFVVIAAPEVTRIMLRLDKTTKELPGGRYTLSPADLGLPPRGDRDYRPWPAVAVTGQTANGTAVPASSG